MNLKLRHCWNCRVYCVGLFCWDCVRAWLIGGGMIALLRYAYVRVHG